MSTDQKPVTIQSKNCHYLASSDTEDEVDNLFEEMLKQVDNKDKWMCAKSGQLMCVQCAPTRHFKKQKTLDLHNQFYHSAAKRFKCKHHVVPGFECGQKFHSKTQLGIHQTLYKHH